MSVAQRESVWQPQYRWVTIGTVAMIFMAATQSVSLTTVMPLVSADLNGEALYAVAFTATLAASVIGMVGVGAWCDRSAPLMPLATATLFFLLGLVVAASAQTMEILVVGRLIQGLGLGGQTVCLYVVIARVYPAVLHGRVFAAFSSAWILPSLIGPALAGAVAEFAHWRWVFGGVAVLGAAAFTLVYVRLRNLPISAGEAATTPIVRRLALASLLAAATVALSLSGEFPDATPVVVAVAVVVIVVALRPLVPRGTGLSARGLSSVVLMRGMIAGALFGAEVYVPYFLIDVHGFAATWAGLGLTTAALAWAVMAEVQGRVADRLGNRRIALLGVAQLTLSLVGAAIVAGYDLPAWIVIASWTLAGSGMGLMYPRLTVLTLAYSTPRNQGFNSAALSISDSIGAAVTIAVMGIVFTASGDHAIAFALVFALAAALAALSLLPGLRLDRAPRPR